MAAMATANDGLPSVPQVQPFPVDQMASAHALVRPLGRHSETTPKYLEMSSLQQCVSQGAQHPPISAKYGPGLTTMRQVWSESGQTWPKSANCVWWPD